MKAYRFSAYCLLGLVLLSCAKEPRENGGLVYHTISAGFAEPTKTQLAYDETNVFWSVNDQVDVWVGETAYPFTSLNSEPTASATFGGEAPSSLGEWVLVYPKSASFSNSGGTVSATLPAVQTARANSYDPSAALISGIGTGYRVTCKHLYSGIRIAFTQTGIKRVSLRGNAGEKIAGEFTFSFSGGTPSINGGTSETIVLNAPGGGTFATGVWYYILCLPTTFSKGLTITADNGSQVGYFTTETSVTFERALIKYKSSFSITNWADIGSAGTVHYGPANTICLQAGSSTTVDVTPRLTTAGWQRSGLETTAAAVVPDGCEVLWGSASASYNAQKLTVSASAAGSSLVAIKKGSTILWSFLVWATASGPCSINLPSGAELQEPLGGNLYFQWGRKDPLMAECSYAENQGDSGLSYSIQHPTEYIQGGSSTYDWYTNNTWNFDDCLWGDGGRKTVWDPCPEGWKVPSWSVFSGLSEADARFTDIGFISNNAAQYSGLTYWTATPDEAHIGFSCAFSNQGGGEYDYEGDARYLGAPVRCVKDN